MTVHARPTHSARSGTATCLVWRFLASFVDCKDKLYGTGRGVPYGSRQRHKFFCYLHAAKRARRTIARPRSLNRWRSQPVLDRRHERTRRTRAANVQALAGQSGPSGLFSHRAQPELGPTSLSATRTMHRTSNPLSPPARCTTRSAAQAWARRPAKGMTTVSGPPRCATAIPGRTTSRTVRTRTKRDRRGATGGEVAVWVRGPAAGMGPYIVTYRPAHPRGSRTSVAGRRYFLPGA